MYRFSKTSIDRLNTCHNFLVLLFTEVIKYIDITILEGHRTVKTQQEYYAKGRTVPGKRVTDVDGVTKKGAHNHTPSLAVDVAPFPINWHDEKRFNQLANIVYREWDVLKKKGLVSGNLFWGKHIKGLSDLPHWELR